MFTLNAQPGTACHQHLEMRTLCQQCRKLWRCTEQLLKVVEEKQEMFVSQRNLQLLGKRMRSDLSDSQLPGNGRNYQFGIAERCQRDKTGTISKLFTHLQHHLQTQVSLADTAWA